MKSDVLHVVCVDDENYMLNAVKRLVRRLRPRWHVIRSSNADDWYSKLNGVEPDIVVSDLLMPGTDGKGLLERVREQFPTSIRVLLTGNTHSQVKETAFEFAHFVLPKPFESNDFEHLFDCAERLRKLPFDNQCRKNLGQLKALPVLPDSIKKLRQTLSSDDCDNHAIAAIVSDEPALVAKIFQVANSSFLGFRKHTNVLPEAIARIGQSLTESLAISLLSEFATEHQKTLHQQYILETIKVANVARYIAQRLKLPISQRDDLSTAALLSCIGMIVQQSVSQSDPMQSCELQSEFLDQHVIAAYILTLWGFNVDICEILLFQSNDLVDDNRNSRLANLLNVSRAFQKVTSQQDLIHLNEHILSSWQEQLYPILEEMVNSDTNR